jgi:hypothetical protein
MVHVYGNAPLLGSRAVSRWTCVVSGGYVGLWFINANNVVVDDCGKGTVVG